MTPLKWTLEKIVKFVEEQNYEFIEHISGFGKESKIKIWCKNPNHEPYEVIFNNFKRGTRCLKCYNEKRIIWTDEKIKEYIEERGYNYLEKKGKGTTSRIVIQCPRGHIYETRMSTFSQGCNCKQCFAEDNFTPIEEMLSVIDQRGDKLINMLEYHGIETRFVFQCDKCGKNYEKDYEHYILGGKCPHCSESKGERKIRHFLEKNNIKFISQYRTDECRRKYPLPFDFYIKINDNEFMIEYDGLEHFQAIEFFGGEEKFKVRKENDNIKENYCKVKNIELIRISYWDFDNIEEILKEKLNLK